MFILQFLVHSITDIVLLLSVVLYLAAERKRSLIMTVFLTVSLILSSLITLLFYSYIREVAMDRLAVSVNIATVIGMLVILGACALVFSLGYYLTDLNISTTLRSYRFLPATVFFGIVSYVTILAMTITLLYTLPVMPILGDFLNGSVFIRSLAFSNTVVERKINNLFGKGPYHTALAVTVKPNSTDRVHLNFSANSLRSISTQSLTSSIRSQRIAANVPIMQDYPELDTLANRVALQMASSGYLSRTNIQGATLYDILDRFDISYQSATMLISFAKNDQLAINQWMSIPVYRQIITHPQYTMIGSAAVQATPYGNIYLLIFLR
jgi:uncharacterized protein YkwD